VGLVAVATVASLSLSAVAPVSALSPKLPISRVAQIETHAASVTNPTAQTISSATSKRLRKVVRYALSKVGGRYSTGGTGPRSFDCSGLTMMAYRQIGVEIPHYSVFQWNQTRHVSRSKLRPGDLVFFFKGIRHVGLYIGGGRFVHAANHRAGVTISSLSEWYYVKRLTGFGRVVS